MNLISELEAIVTNAFKCKSQLPALIDGLFASKIILTHTLAGIQGKGKASKIKSNGKDTVYQIDSILGVAAFLNRGELVHMNTLVDVCMLQLQCLNNESDGIHISILTYIHTFIHS